MAVKADIRNKALDKHGLIASGQTADSNHQADLDAAYDEVYEELRTEGLAVWPSTGTINDELVNPLVALVASKRLDEYGVPDRAYQSIASQAANAIPQIRRILARPYTGSSVKINNF